MHSYLLRNLLPPVCLYWGTDNHLPDDNDNHSVHYMLWNLFSCKTMQLIKACFLDTRHISSKRALLREKSGIKISYGYEHLHIMSFITTKFQEILLSGFRGVVLTRKTGLTDWRVKNIIPSATCCEGYNYLYRPYALIHACISSQEFIASCLSLLRYR